MSGKTHNSWLTCQMHYRIKNNSMEREEKLMLLQKIPEKDGKGESINFIGGERNAILYLLFD